MSSASWIAIFDGISTATVSAGVVVAIRQLVATKNGRLARSLNQLLEEFQKFADLEKYIYSNFPITIDKDLIVRTSSLSRQVIEAKNKGCNEWDVMNSLLRDAFRLVCKLNDLGTLVENGAVRQRDFFQNHHQRLIPIAYILEPFTILVSAVTGDRWGLRIGRLRKAAEVFHSENPLYMNDPVMMHGNILYQLEPVNTKWWNFGKGKRRKKFITPASREDRSPVYEIKHILSNDDVDILKNIVNEFYS